MKELMRRVYATNMCLVEVFESRMHLQGIRHTVATMIVQVQGT